jgi:competence protein ComEA
VKQLTALTQIGHKKAERILEHREKNGPFEQLEDIMKVKGIGSKTFEVNKDRIAVE